MMRSGVDFASISEFRRLFSSDKMSRAIFAPEELATCSDWSPSRRAEFLAGRFSGKEAVFKALNTLSESFRDLRYNQIVIGRGQWHEPIVTLDLAPDRWRALDVSVSLAHKQDNVIAFAVVEEKSYEW